MKPPFYKRKQTPPPEPPPVIDDRKPQASEKPRCSDCSGQLNKVCAVNLKDGVGRPLEYEGCPGDCSGLTRKDLAAGPRES